MGPMSPMPLRPNHGSGVARARMHAHARCESGLDWEGIGLIGPIGGLGCRKP